jgi:Notch-like protein
MNYLFHHFKYPFPNIQWLYTSTGELWNINKSLKTKNSCSYNEIPIKILKTSALFLISPLTYTCNKSFSLDIFPDRLKYSIIKPIFKNRDKLITSNYRPIFLLTSFSKVFGKLIS